ncbi:DUF4861 domain-containing protein [Flavobacterium circumlabens]|uniref:DUF4861 domain-containing protein n=1 Tax=Flavobacterium circumlabens TaxID=2133765 RepID=A0A4Y7UG59_9FLAO|nr:DUF4861 domain-containing protein [Flavobacterium circumlabens]
MQSFFLLAILFPLALLAQTKATVSIQNTTASDRKEAVVSVKWETIVSHYPQIDTTNFVVINSITKKQVPFQLEHQGFKTIQNLLVQVNVKAKSVLQLSIQKGKHSVFETKTYARFVPERKDDFAWENDRIAFRAYGKALEKTKEDAYGLDVWVKRTDKMILNERYKIGDYHIDHGNGLDYYHVGFTLGAGNMAPYVKDTIRYSANYHQWKVLDNGPLRSSFILTYDTWDADRIKVKATKKITLEAGSQLNRIENVYTYESNALLPVVVGIIKRLEKGILSLNEQQGIMGYWEPSYGKDGTTGVGAILTTPVSNITVGTAQLLAKTEVKNNEAIVYYTGAAWDKAGKITTATHWFDYLNKFSQELKNPLIVSVK